jgi:hypothetical protein
MRFILCAKPRTKSCRTARIELFNFRESPITADSTPVPIRFRNEADGQRFGDFPNPGTAGRDELSPFQSAARDRGCVTSCRAFTSPTPNIIRTPMHLTKQLAIFLDNRPGALARVCDALSEAKINIYAITTSDTVDHSVVRMVVSDPRRALLIFEEHGTLVVDDDVLMIEGDNKPGSLATICKKLAAAKVNIEYCYCATSPDAKKGLLILRPSDAKKALKALNT